MRGHAREYVKTLKSSYDYTQNAELIASVNIPFLLNLKLLNQSSQLWLSYSNVVQVLQTT